MSNQFSVIFSIPATNLDLGLHPFYAVVTDLNGVQYRTATQWLRLVGLDSPFPLQITAPPALLVGLRPPAGVTNLERPEPGDTFKCVPASSPPIRSANGPRPTPIPRNNFIASGLHHE